MATTAPSAEDSAVPGAAPVDGSNVVPSSAPAADTGESGAAAAPGSAEAATTAPAATKRTRADLNGGASEDAKAAKRGSRTGGDSAPPRRPPGASKMEVMSIGGFSPALAALSEDDKLATGPSRGRAKRARKEPNRLVPGKDVPSSTEAKWVQCDKPSCRKWRQLPAAVDLDKLPASWTCDQNTWDPARASCDVPEVSYKLEAVPLSSSRPKKDRRERPSSNPRSGGSRARSGRGGMSSGLDPHTWLTSEQVNWVQCDRCGVWRGVPMEISTDSLPEKWFCENNTWWPALASCRVPEETWSETPGVPPPGVTSLLNAGMLGGEGIGDLDDDGATMQSEYSMVDGSSVHGASMGKSRRNRSRNRGDKKARYVGDGFNDDASMKSKSRRRPRVSLAAKRLAVETAAAQSATASLGGIEQQKPADQVKWAQCEACKKWRIVPSFVDVEQLPERWYCEMNEWDPQHAHCDAAEQTAPVKGLVPWANRSNKLSYRDLILGAWGGRRANSISSTAMRQAARASDSRFKGSSMYKSTLPPAGRNWRGGRRRKGSKKKARKRVSSSSEGDDDEDDEDGGDEDGNGDGSEEGDPEGENGAVVSRTVEPVEFDWERTLHTFVEVEKSDARERERLLRFMLASPRPLSVADMVRCFAFDGRARAPPLPVELPRRVVQSIRVESEAQLAASKAAAEPGTETPSTVPSPSVQDDKARVAEEPTGTATDTVSPALADAAESRAGHALPADIAGSAPVAATDARLTATDGDADRSGESGVVAGAAGGSGGPPAGGDASSARSDTAGTAPGATSAAERVALADTSGQFTAAAVPEGDADKTNSAEPAPETRDGQSGSAQVSEGCTGWSWPRSSFGFALRDGETPETVVRRLLNVLLATGVVVEVDPQAELEKQKSSRSSRKAPGAEAVPISADAPPVYTVAPEHRSSTGVHVAQLGFMLPLKARKPWV